jgi:hypothetical protein
MAARKPRAKPVDIPIDLSDEPLVDTVDVPFTAQRINDLADSAAAQKTIPRSYAPIDAEMIAIAMGGIFLVGTRIISRRALGDTSGAMTSDEIDHICNPIARILLRHIPLVGQAKGDTADLVAVLLTISSYSVRLWDLSDQRSQQSKRQPSDAAPLQPDSPTPIRRAEWTQPVVFPASSVQTS